MWRIFARTAGGAQIAAGARTPTRISPSVNSVAAAISGIKGRADALDLEKRADGADPGKRLAYKLALGVQIAVDAMVSCKV